MDKMMGNLGAKLQSQFVSQKDNYDFAQSLKALDGLDDYEKILQLKAMITKQTQSNKQLTTKTLKVKTETEKTLRFIEEAKSVPQSKGDPKPLTQRPQTI